MDPANYIKSANTALLTSLFDHSIKTKVITISLVIVLCFNHNGCASESISSIALAHGHKCALLNTVVVMYALSSLVSGNSVQTLCGTYTVDDWVDDLINDENNILQLTNAHYTGACSASGRVSFDDGINYIGYNTVIGTTALVLTTGNLNTAASTLNTGTGTTTNNGVSGDADLNALLNGFTTHDASIIEFDIVSPVGFDVSFTYIFASEEYNEWVGSAFNDVFALWLNDVNVALIGSTVVAINNVNKNQLSEYFVNNGEVGSQIGTEYDGLTVALATSVFEVTADEVVHVKLAIADAGDSVLDSAIFIKPKSFDIVLPTTSDPTKDPTSDPTKDPTSDPTKDPTSDPTKDPTNDPTKDPTVDCHKSYVNTCRKQRHCLSVTYNYGQDWVEVCMVWDTTRPDCCGGPVSNTCTADARDDNPMEGPLCYNQTDCNAEYVAFSFKDAFGCSDATDTVEIEGVEGGQTVECVVADTLDLCNDNGKNKGCAYKIPFDKDNCDVNVQGNIQREEPNEATTQITSEVNDVISQTPQIQPKTNPIDPSESSESSDDVDAFFAEFEGNIEDNMNSNDKHPKHYTHTIDASMPMIFGLFAIICVANVICYCWFYSDGQNKKNRLDSISTVKN